jgi:hypothetical protein
MSAETGGLLLVHAHPDDEVFSTGGVIARSLTEGRRVDLVGSAPSVMPSCAARWPPWAHRRATPTSSTSISLATATAG